MSERKKLICEDTKDTIFQMPGTLLLKVISSAFFWFNGALGGTCSGKTVLQQKVYKEV